MCHAVNDGVGHIRFAHLLVHELDFIDGKKQSEEPRVISIVIYGCIDKKSILTMKMRRSSMIIVDKSVIIIIRFMKMIFVAESVEDAASVQSASVGGLKLLLARIFIIVTITSTMSPPSHHQSHHQCHHHHIVNVIIINVNINNGIITIPLLD